jgi:Excreted virulence factor EspC, type VII ESX diderm
MHADTGAIRGYGTFHCGFSDDAGEIVDSLAALPVMAAAGVFGPIGDRFLQALVAATEQLAAMVAALATDASTIGVASQAAAGFYEAVEHCVSERISRV